MIDLIILVPDGDYEQLLYGLLPRISIIEKINEFTYEIIVHQNRDPGVYTTAHDVLRPFNSIYKYALVFVDRVGSGQETKSREQIEADIEDKLTRNGWQERRCCISIDPEIESWIWVKSKRLYGKLNWKNDSDLYNWIKEKGFIYEQEVKPNRPKEALQYVLRHTRLPKSSSLYRSISSVVSYNNCVDKSFSKFISILKAWFSK